MRKVIFETIKMSLIYCGNNKKSPQLKKTRGKPRVEIGTPYECFRKGVAIGYDQPVDASFRGKYEPIDTRRFYCGKGDLPEGYHDYGTLCQCFTKGVDVGKLVKSKKKKSVKKKKRSPKEPRPFHKRP